MKFWIYTRIFNIPFTFLLLVLCFFYLSFNSYSLFANEKFIVVDQNHTSSLLKEFNDVNLKLIHRNDHTAVVRVPSAAALEKIQHFLHEKTGKCGNFTETETGVEEAIHEAKTVHNLMVEVKRKQQQMQTMNYLFTANYNISRQAEVNNILPLLTERNIYQVIERLSSFPTRYFQSNTSQIAAQTIYDHWRYLLKDRPDSSVEYIKHSFRQPTVMAQIKGKSSEEIVVGGHLDSVLGASGSYHAPGADDNASGIAVISELMRVLVEKNYQPQNTITFFGYAAEEVGLVGSRDVAKWYRQQNKSVIGVMQLDMTNYAGSGEKIFLTSDNTNPELTAFLGKLIEEYVKIPYALHKCGYGCSDHASWFKEGFVAVNPFEASYEKREHNLNIHTVRDTLAVSNNSASHSMHFAKLAVAFVLELDK